MLNTSTDSSDSVNLNNYSNAASTSQLLSDQDNNLSAAELDLSVVYDDAVCTKPQANSTKTKFRRRSANELRRPIVVDGYDIVGKQRDCRRIVQAVRYFLLRGHQVIVVAPSFLPRNPDIQHGDALETLNRWNVVVYVHCQTREHSRVRDTLEWRILQESYPYHGCVVSHSQFREALRDKNSSHFYTQFVHHYLLMPTYMRNSADLMFAPDGPMGRRGMNFEDTIKMQRDGSAESETCAKHQLRLKHQYNLVSVCDDLLFGKGSNPSPERLELDKIFKDTKELVWRARQRAKLERACGFSRSQQQAQQQTQQQQTQQQQTQQQTQQQHEQSTEAPSASHTNGLGPASTGRRHRLLQQSSSQRETSVTDTHATADHGMNGVVGQSSDAQSKSTALTATQQQRSNNASNLDSSVMFRRLRDCTTETEAREFMKEMPQLLNNDSAIVKFICQD